MSPSQLLDVKLSAFSVTGRGSTLEGWNKWNSSFSLCGYQILGWARCTLEGTGPKTRIRKEILSQWVLILMLDHWSTLVQHSVSHTVRDVWPVREERKSLILGWNSHGEDLTAFHLCFMPGEQKYMEVMSVFLPNQFYPTDLFLSLFTIPKGVFSWGSKLKGSRIWGRGTASVQK